MSKISKFSSKGGRVEYTSNAGEVVMTMEELERAALKEVGKLLRKAVKAKAPKDTGNLRRNIATWVKRKGPQGPHVEIGVYNKKKAKGSYAFYAHFLEFGTRQKGPRPFLKPAVFANIDQIRIIQGKYLKEIENENRAKGLIDPSEEIKDD